MLRIALVSSVLVILGNIPVSHAEKISTTSCDAPQAINETRKKDGKTYSCTSKTTCKTTTCDTGTTAACSVTTSTSYDCTEVTASGPRGAMGGVTAGGRGAVLDRGTVVKARPRVVGPLGGIVKSAD